MTTAIIIVTACAILGALIYISDRTERKRRLLTGIPNGYHHHPEDHPSHASLMYAPHSNPNARN